MPSPTLPGAALRHLRSLGHELNPVINVGKSGVTDSLVEETKRALLQHELIKVRVQGEAPVDRKEAAADLAEKTASVLAQVLGRTFLLYKRHPKKPKIVIPGVGTSKKTAAKATESARSKKKGAPARKPGAKASSTSGTPKKNAARRPASSDAVLDDDTDDSFFE